MTRGHPSPCEQDALQPKPKVIRANIRASRNQFGRLPDRSDALYATVSARWEIRTRIERARAHLPPSRWKSALRRHLLFALAHRTAGATRSARGVGRSQYSVADYVRRGTQSCVACCASFQERNP